VSDAVQSLKAWWPWVLVLGALGLVFGPTLAMHISRGFDPHAVIAGWPFTAIENVPYVARRTAFLTFETHQTFHQRYVDTMRGRMRALIDATLATSNDPLIRLRDEHGVTHMLVYLPHLRGARLTYFKPFDEWIARARHASAGKPLSLRDLVDNHAIYRDRSYALVDLRELTGPS
jgi:hypothetical protein